MVSYKLNSYNVRFGDTRRTACVGFLLRSSFSFFAQVPRFRLAETEVAQEPAAPGAIEDDYREMVAELAGSCG